MKISRQKQPLHDKPWTGWHVLTVAEEGFSGLSFYAESCNGISKHAVVQFAERVNRTNESGSLHPQAPVSAVPNRFFRELAFTTDPVVLNEFKRHLRDFLAANESSIRAAKVLIDFRVSGEPVPEHYLDATEKVLREQSLDSVLQEAVILT